MEITLTVKQLIDQLSKVDENLPVYFYYVGLTADDSWIAPLGLENDTVDVYEDKCLINI